MARSLLQAALILCSGAIAAGQKVDGAIKYSSEPNGVSAAGAESRLSMDEIVQKLADGEKRRAEDLKGYVEERHYTVAYRGFPANLSATMVVEAKFDAPTTKHFEVVSTTGSKMLADHVLRKLLEAEEEATADPGQTAPTTANYNFTLVDRQFVDGRLCYVLQVEPRTSSKLLYRGTIWVDAEDFAVTKIEAEPARNPSFWIRQTRIHHTNTKTGEFWLPERNESETDVRLGGRATLTIEYGPYKLQSSDLHDERTDLTSPAPSGK